MCVQWLGSEPTTEQFVLVCFGLRYSLILYSTRYLYLDFETMNEELKRERALASFDPNELSAFLYGGEDNCAALKNFGM